MNEYNFDPFTGEPIKKEPVAPAEESGQVMSGGADSFARQEPEQGAQGFSAEEQGGARPSEENPVYHYAYPKAEAPKEEPAFQGGYSAPKEPIYGPPVQKEKPAPKMVTRKTFIATIAAMLVFSLLLTVAGVYTALRLVPGGKTLTGTAVIYKTAKLESADGGSQKEELTIPQVAELVKDSVVEITTEQIVTGSFMQQYVSEGAGSGVIFTKDGYIVTNHHVIDGATNINVRLADGTEYKAKLIGSDAKSDLAVLKVEAEELSPAAFGESEGVKVGDTVVAVGNPLGKLGGTVTRGIISALDRAITIDNITMNLLQTDTAINPGNSGGGMFNTSGQLVGVINAKSAGEEIEGLGFAIPIDTAKKVIEDLIQLGYVSGRVDPGFVFVEINDSMTAMMYRVSELGLYISETESGSDSQKAGFKSGDLVVSVEGEKVKTEAEANAIIDRKSVGDAVTIVVKRGGKEQSISMTLSEYIPEKQKETMAPVQQTPSNPLSDFFSMF